MTVDAKSRETKSPAKMDLYQGNWILNVDSLCRNLQQFSQKKIIDFEPTSLLPVKYS